MKKLSKKTLAYSFMLIGIILLIAGIVMSISLGAKEYRYIKQ